MVQGTMPGDAAVAQALCADEQGFSLHAAVRCAANERQRLEQLRRYITRLALANEGVQYNVTGQVVLRPKTPWRDGTTHLVMSPLEFMQRLAALVPRPRLRLIRFHGVVAPNPKLRARGWYRLAGRRCRRIGARRARVSPRTQQARAHQAKFNRKLTKCASAWATMADSNPYRQKR